MDQALRSYHDTQFERADAETGEVTAVISTGNLARDGAIIETSGWDFSAYNRNPVVLWAHDDAGGFSIGHSGGLPIARTEEITVDGDRIVARAVMDMDDPFAEQVLRKVRNGFIRSTSVRWRPLRTSRRTMQVEGKDRDVLVFERQELLEWSFVAVPADPGALIVRAADGARLDLADYSEPSSADALLEAVRELQSCLTAAERIDADAEDTLRGLYRALEARLALAPPQQPEPFGDAADQLERALTVAAERLARPFDPMPAIVRALARATGRSEQDLMRRLEGQSA